MNFLAHIYLSGDNDMVKIGNFMADSLHGKKPEDFPDEVKKGILLHRAIDTFTDNHPVFRQSTKRLHPIYHHYSGVIVDIFYDHFLAKNWSDYHTVPLEEYAESFYTLLKNNEDVLTDRTQKVISYMIPQNWLVKYADTDGIAVILAQMDRRTKNKSGMANSIAELKEFYTEFEKEFREFFEELKAFAKHKIKSL